MQAYHELLDEIQHDVERLREESGGGAVPS